MNVAELIDILRSYPAEARVVVQGYEFGFDDITSVARQPLAIGANLTARPGFGGGRLYRQNMGLVPTTRRAAGHYRMRSRCT